MAARPQLTLAARVLAAMGVAIPVLILLAAALTAHLTAGGRLVWLRAPFLLVCHGMPTRAFHVSGSPLPVCARCTGIDAGLALCCLLMLLIPRFPRINRGIWLALAIAPLVIDGVTQAAGLRESTNLTRVLTGVLAGMVFAVWATSRVDSLAVESQRNSMKTQPLLPLADRLDRACAIEYASPTSSPDIQTVVSGAPDAK